MGFSDDRTENQLKKLEKRIAKTYKQAAKEMSQTVDGYWNGYTDKNGVWHDGYTQRYEKEKKKWKAGFYTDDQWKEWQKAQIGRGKRWEAMRDKMVDQTMKANEKAISYVNGETPSIYALNHNYSLYQIEGANVGTSFTIVDENTVKRLMEEKNHVNFRVLRQDRTADYNWNKERITNALAQGILQGEHPHKIANRFLEVMGSNQAAAIRNARTAVTSAQNGGRMDSYAEAEKMGITVIKEWLATSDSRTRASHIHANGQRRPWNKPFQMGHGTLMFPGDPAGHPAEVYNCRCTLITVLPGIRNNVPQYDENLRYQEWLYRKRLDVTAGNGILRVANSTRNSTPLTDKQIENAKNYAIELGIEEGMIGYSENYYTSLSPIGILLIGTDAYPSKKILEEHAKGKKTKANALLSYKAAIAHEVVGHHETLMKGTNFEEKSALDEAQASIRAAKFAPGLSKEERRLLMKDAYERLKKAGIKLSDVKHKMDILER